jgi:DsbC/DsbD-like thiol-disulfide interchange protein/cytochrome c biogenesis protein CcdA
VPHARFFPLLTRLFLACWFALAASFALITPASAQAKAPSAPLFGSDRIAVRLHADGAPAEGKEWLLALHFTPSAPEWHGYWSNPGDAGAGMQLALDLPPDWEVGEPRYPVPKQLVLSGLMNHIYEGPYTVLVPVVPGPSLASFTGPVKATVDYLACSDICVPQHAEVTAQPGGDFARWRAEIAPLLDARARFAIDGKRLRIAIPLPQSMALADPHVFVANPKLVAHAAPQVLRRVEDVLVAEITLDEYGSGKAESLAGILAFTEQTGVRFAADLGDVPSGGDLVTGSKDAPAPPWWSLVLGALLGGLLLNIMPCVFPILSLKAIALARAGESQAAARAEGLAYTAGVVLACLMLGGLWLALRAAGEQVGWAFQLQEPGVVVALLVLAFVITANLAGVFELPAILVNRGGDRAGAFATGLLAAFVATPCTGPFMAAALGAALLLPVPQALLLFGLLGLGLALPFLLLGFVPPLRRMLPKPGAWMQRFRYLMAIPMGLMAFALLWLTVQLGGRGFGLIALVLVFGVVLALFVVGRLQRMGKMAWPAFGLVAAPFLVFALIALPNVYAAKGVEAKPSLLAAQPFSRDALAAARASGKPVFVYFTADWCVTCKVNEAASIERESVRDAFAKAGVTVIVGDWTLKDEAIATFLTEQGAAGVPLHLWYAPGEAPPQQLPQVLTPGLLEQHASGKR